MVRATMHWRVKTVARGPGISLPGDVKRTIEAHQAPDPLWYVGRTGPSVQDVLDATDEALETLRRSTRGFNGNGNGQQQVTRRSRATGPTT